jgi:protein arginine kinase activator
MLCQNCHKNLATVRYAEVVDGHVQECRLCPTCLSTRQEPTSTGFELVAPQTVQSSVSVRRAVKEALRSCQSCPDCGALLHSVAKESLAGCSQCYAVFSEEVGPLLIAGQGSDCHQGKVPHVDGLRQRLQVDLRAKRSLLRSVLNAENYEEAAILRDEIQCLEQGMSASEAGTD